MLEVVLRQKYGFCDAPLCMESTECEYIFQPSQNRHRFGNEIKYNSFSQKSEEPDSTKIIILGLGDSVINGGVQTDQKELATTISSDSKYQILNISAGSWGPDNCAAYLDKYGLFNAQKILLVVSSHDSHDIMDFAPIVDIHKSYPSKQYKLAVWELIDRYVLPRLASYVPDPDQEVLNGIDIKKGDGVFNPGFVQLKNIADNAGISMEIYLHPDQKEFENGKFNEQGMEIIKWAKETSVQLTTGFEAGESHETYRDGIHVNQKGQKVIAKWMYDACRR